MLRKTSEPLLPMTTDSVIELIGEENFLLIISLLKLSAYIVLEMVFSSICESEAEDIPLESLRTSRYRSVFCLLRSFRIEHSMIWRLRPRPWFGCAVPCS